MTGTFLNIFTVIVGGVIGLLFGTRFPSRVRESIVSGLGLFTASYGVMIFLDNQNPLVVLGAILIGGIIGEWLRIETGLENIGGWLEKRFVGNSQSYESKGESTKKFIRGFLTASLVFA